MTWQSNRPAKRILSEYADMDLGIFIFVPVLACSSREPICLRWKGGYSVENCYANPRLSFILVERDDGEKARRTRL